MQRSNHHSNKYNFHFAQMQTKQINQQQCDAPILVNSPTMVGSPPRPPGEPLEINPTKMSTLPVTLTPTLKKTTKITISKPMSTALPPPSTKLSATP
mmetsp:Transcript_8784/g.18977  ORF Transcript_8784/g.18977 Transcript_8784/m.18977 type:complete len:97 (+) Transcript_8784:1817-2107(+)